MSRLVKNVVLCDIDHTISDAAWRDTMLEGADRWAGWDAYHLESSKDRPIVSMVGLINSLFRSRHYIAMFTSRPEKHRQLTNDWLVSNAVSVHEVLMRPDEAFHPAAELKMKLSRERFSIEDEVLMVIDDRDDVCAAFRAIGVTTLQVGAAR